jgi:ABC-type nickel/cobalt efflux system permease component RcnA
MDSVYEALGGLRHRHGALVHQHPHAGPHLHRGDPGAHAHAHGHAEDGGHGHSHGLVDPSSRLDSRALLAAITFVILRITQASWRTVRAG